MVDLAEELGQSGFFTGGKTAQNKVDIAEFGAQIGVVSAQTEASKIGGFEMFGDGFETVIAGARTFGAKTERAKREIKIITDNEDVTRGELVKMHEFSYGEAGIVIKSLGFDKEAVAILEPKRMKAGLLPGELVGGGVKIQCQKTEVVTGKIVFVTRVAEAND